jgi:DNA-binding transcriptional LysR family regulator
MRLPALKFLRTFQVAASRLSFKVAAEELFVTPSAVSHQIKALEEQLGVVLFERGPRALTLTDAGRNYLQHVQTIFARLERVTEQLQIRHGRSVVRLRTPPFFATELLLPRLQSFLEAQPDTDIHIDTDATPPAMHAAMQICRSWLAQRRNTGMRATSCSRRRSCQRAHRRCCSECRSMLSAISTTIR